MATTKLITKVTYKMVTTDDNGKETRQHMKTVTYEYRDFNITLFPALLVNADGVLNN